MTADPSRHRSLPGDELGALVAGRLSEMAVPAAIVLVRSADDAWAEAFGTRRIDVDAPVTTDDHFRIGSNTKTMTGTGSPQLVDAGLVSLDDPRVEVPARRSRRRPHHRGPAPGHAQRVAQLHDVGVVQPGPRPGTGPGLGSRRARRHRSRRTGGVRAGRRVEYSNTNTASPD